MCLKDLLGRSTNLSISKSFWNRHKINENLVFFPVLWNCEILFFEDALNALKIFYKMTIHVTYYSRPFWRKDLSHSKSLWNSHRLLCWAENSPKFAVMLWTIASDFCAAVVSEYDKIWQTLRTQSPITPFLNWNFNFKGLKRLFRSLK